MANKPKLKPEACWPRVNVMAAMYRNEIDGLRAISILSVVLFHSDFDVFGGGFVGVDVFFVISGYLITRNIVSDLEAGRFTFSQFYVRRIRRLFPALFFTVLASFAASIILLSPEDLRDFGRIVIATLGAVSNFAFWRDTRDYFVTDVSYLPLLHTWSLSVEEQFYLVCPAALFLMARAGHLRRFGAVFAMAGMISLLASEIWLRRDASAVFYLVPFRVFEFAIGALCIEAEKWRPKSVLALQTLEVLGLAAIAIAVFTFTKRTPFPGAAALLPCLGAALVIYAGDVPRIGKLLTNRLAVGIGLISYSLYLCHWPIMVFARYAVGEVTSLHGRLLLIALSLVVAIAMYRFVEAPFRKSGIAVTPTGFWKLAGVCAALTLFLVASAAVVVRSDGWASRLSEPQRLLQLEHRYGLAACIADAASPCAFGDLQAPLGVQLVGDSHMEHLIPAFVAVAQALHLRGEAHTQGGCTMLLGLQRIEASGNINSACRRFRDETLARLGANDAPVVISQRWDVGALADDAGTAIALPTTEAHMAAWRQALLKTIATLGRARPILLIGAQVVLACEVDRRAVKIGPLSPDQAVAPCPDLPLAAARSRTAAINAMLADVRRQYPDNVRLLLPQDYICDSGYCISISEGRLLHQDSGHFTVAGAKYLGLRADGLLREFLLSGGAGRR